jgi:hypothetical protein
MNIHTAAIAIESVYDIRVERDFNSAAAQQALLLPGMAALQRAAIQAESERQADKLRKIPEQQHTATALVVALATAWTVSVVKIVVDVATTVFTQVFMPFAGMLATLYPS